MYNAVHFTMTALAGTNKVGTMKVLDGGYREVVLGGLNVYNSRNDYYPFEPAKALFQESSQLMRRISSGSLRGENGHPKWLPNMSEQQYVQRILQIWEENISHHIRAIRLDFENYKDKEGRPFIAVIGEVCPSGAKGDQLERSFSNPHENVCFSVRSLTEDTRERGRCTKVIRNLVTWDLVNEPGIASATKWNSPSLESLSEDLVITPASLNRSFESTNGRGLESMALTPAELYKSFNWEIPESNRPKWFGW